MAAQHPQGRRRGVELGVRRRVEGAALVERGDGAARGDVNHVHPHGAPHALHLGGELLDGVLNRGGIEPERGGGGGRRGEGGATGWVPPGAPPGWRRQQRREGERT